jgi:endonuclease/exonuclease/phosphatase family metal-dependent hydrolase
MFVCLGVNKRFEFHLEESQIHKQQEYARCTNAAAEGLYRIGYTLTRPFLRQMSTATCIFGPYSWPGKSEETVTTSERVIRILRGIELFTLVIPLIAVVIGVIGLCLKFIAVQWSPPVSLMENSALDFKEYDGKIDVMTYNTCLMPAYIANVNGLRSSRTRAAEIGRQIVEQSPDIVCFQEGFHADSTRILCDALKDVYPQVLHNVAPSETVMNSGLVVASKYKIVEVKYRPFHNLAAEDELANKGLLRLTLDLGAGRTAACYTTHLQAKIGEKYAAIRKDQVRMIRAYIEADCASETHEKIILCGDLNLHPGEIEGAQEILGEAFVRQIPEKEMGTIYDQSGTWGTTGWSRETRVNQIDHIFSYRGEEGRSRIHQLGEGRDWISGISDHLPVSSIL